MGLLADEVLVSLRNIPHGTHGLFAWDEPCAALRAAKAFADGGLARNELVAFDSNGPEDEVELALASVGIDPRLVRVVDTSEALERARCGDFGGRTELRRRLVEEARRERKRGVRLFGKFSYALYLEGRYREALSNEEENLSSRVPMTTLCTFNTSSLEPERDCGFFVRMLRSHERIYFPGIAVTP